MTRRRRGCCPILVLAADRFYRFVTATTVRRRLPCRARCVATVWAAPPTQCRWLFAPIVLLTFSGSPLARSRSYGVRVRRGHPAREGCSPGRTCLGLQSGLGRWGHAHKTDERSSMGDRCVFNFAPPQRATRSFILRSSPPRTSASAAPLRAAFPAVFKRENGRGSTAATRA